MWRKPLCMSGIIWLAACSTGDLSGSGGEQAEPTEVDASSVVTPADIPGDIHEDSRARLPLVVRDALDADGQRAYDIMVSPDSRYSDGLRGPVAMWAYSPLLAEHIFPASTYLRFGTDKDQRLTELAILATAREVRSQYEWSGHEPLGLDAGLEPAIIDLVRHRTDLDSVGDLDGLGDQERVIIRFVREIVSEERVSSATFTHARELFGERGLMDLTGLVGYYNYVNLTIKAFNVQLAPGRTRLLPDLW